MLKLNQHHNKYINKLLLCCLLYRLTKYDPYHYVFNIFTKLTGNDLMQIYIILFKYKYKQFNCEDLPFNNFILDLGIFNIFLMLVKNYTKLANHLFF